MLFHSVFKHHSYKWDDKEANRVCHYDRNKLDKSVDGHIFEDDESGDQSTSSLLDQTDYARNIRCFRSERSSN